MKILLPLCLVASLALAATTNRIHLTWDSDPGYETNTTFKVYTQTNVDHPVSGWTLLTNVDFVTFTNAAKPGEFGRVEIPAAEEHKRFFAVTASNIFGETDFSDPVFSRRLPRGSGLKIGAY